MEAITFASRFFAEGVRGNKTEVIPALLEERETLSHTKGLGVGNAWHTQHEHSEL